MTGCTDTTCSFRKDCFRATERKWGNDTLDMKWLRTDEGCGAFLEKDEVRDKEYK